VKGPKTLFEMSWPEVEAFLKKSDIALIPVGSTEQHGLCLPLGSDSFQADDIARRVIAKLEKQGVLATASPTIPFGISQAHMRFPGTMTLTSATLTTVLYEVTSSLYDHGFRRFCYLTGHGGNTHTLMLAADDIAQELEGSKIIVPDWLPVMYGTYSKTLKSPKWEHEHHSGEAETSRMLVTTPKLVNMKKAKALHVTDERDYYAKKPYPGYVNVVDQALDMKTFTETGITGDPSYATAETGEKLYEFVADYLATVIKYEFPAKKK
jgi:creatinine amidohydrolase